MAAALPFYAHLFACEVVRNRVARVATHVLLAPGDAGGGAESHPGVGGSHDDGGDDAHRMHLAPSTLRDAIGLLDQPSRKQRANEDETDAAS